MHSFLDLSKLARPSILLKEVSNFIGSFLVLQVPLPRQRVAAATVSSNEKSVSLLAVHINELPSIFLSSWLLKAVTEFSRYISETRVLLWNAEKLFCNYSTLYRALQILGVFERGLNILQTCHLVAALISFCHWGALHPPETNSFLFISISQTVFHL